MGGVMSFVFRFRFQGLIFLLYNISALFYANTKWFNEFNFNSNAESN